MIPQKEFGDIFASSIPSAGMQVTQFNFDLKSTNGSHTSSHNGKRDINITHTQMHGTKAISP